VDSDAKRAMVIVAHPDDPDFFCGGTIARWVREGLEVIYLILTNGDKGGNNPDVAEQLAALREEEQRAAARVLGVNTIIFLGEPDGELQPTLSLRRRLVREIRRHKPQLIVCPDPAVYYFPLTPTGERRDAGYINHPDHRAAGVAALEAIFPAARNRMYHVELLAEGFEPHAVHEIYLTGTLQPNRWVDISDTIELKIQAIQAHGSQLSDPTVLDRVRERAQDTDQYGQPVYREAFHYVKIR
jgi:LmbE family N-acetylglucosaminyl deacetylase